jgi:AcrR family transcriptional regulator
MGSDDRRKTILEAAARLFRHYGHAKTTMADIAREAGVAVGSVYLDFASKEAIVEELSSTTHVRVLDAMRQAARRAGDEFADQLVAVFRARAAALLELEHEGAHARDLVHCKADGVRSALARFHEEERAFLRALLEDAATAGQIATVDARRTAVLLQRAFATLSPPSLFDLGDEAARLSVEMAELVLFGLLPREHERLRTGRPRKTSRKR